MKIEEFSGFEARNKRAVWIFKLKDNYEYQSNLKTKKFESKWLVIDDKGKITVRMGYSWDGCSFKFNVIDLLVVGTPDGIVDINTMKPKTYYASLIHDALYQYMFYHSITRKEADRLFYGMLKENNFLLRGIYYFAVRCIGWIFFTKKKRTIKRKSI